MVQTLEARSVKEVTKQDILKLIIRRMINNGNFLFYKPWLEREYVLGTVGDRGGGKSASDAVIALVDFMLRGKPVWSNMNISCDIAVSDEMAARYGLNSGGTVNYSSLPVDKEKLLKLDETYRGGCLVLEEINVQYSNVRRFMTNTNLESNELYQQLRKFQTSLIYNVIDEMFVDPQLRTLTDIFIKTYDTAFDVDAMERKKPTGIDFCWQIYPYSGYLNGEQGKTKYGHPASKCFFKFKAWQGIFPTSQHQERGVYSLNKREREKLAKAGLIAESSAETENKINKWQWLIDGIRKIKNSGVEYLEASQLWQVLQVVENGHTPREIGTMLPNFGIKRNHHNQYNQWVYRIETFTLDNEVVHPSEVAARN